MLHESVPLPQGNDLQTESTQALIAKAQAVQEVIKETVELGFRINQHHKNKSPQVKVEVARGTAYKDLWENYSQGVQSERPVQRSLTVARNALKAGTPPEEVQKILAHDPQYAKIQQQQGNEEAKTYTKVMTRAAEKREQLANSSQQQQSQKHHKARNINQKIGMGL